MTNKKVILIASGGHAKVVSEMLIQLNETPKYVVSPTITIRESNEFFEGCQILTEDNQLLEFPPDEVELVNGIGSLPFKNSRFEFYKKFSDLGYSFKTVVSPSAIISPKAKIKEGVHIMAGAIIQSGVMIGENTIINTGAVIDHDCFIGANNHIAPGAILSGNVKTGNQVHIGTNASVIQNINIGTDSIIGAGAQATKDIPIKHTLHPGKPYLIKNEDD